MTARTDRIDELLREEIGAILARDVQDPRIGFVTITDVETAPDLSNAKVWVSIIGQPSERDETVRALKRAMSFVRHELGSRVRLRRIPELHIRTDDSAERGTRVLKLIEDLEAGRDPSTDERGGESLPTPVKRLPHEGDAPEEGSSESRSRPPSRRRRSGPRSQHSGPNRRRHGGRSHR